MKRFIRTTFAAPFALFVLSASPAAAQNTFPYQQPAYRPGYVTPLSPYLNMLIPGNSAVNYYALVEPQFQRRQYRSLNNQTLQALVTQIPPPPGIIPEEEFNAPMKATGHPTAFNYTGSYFNSNMMGQPGASPLGQRRSIAGAGAGAGAMGSGARPGMTGGGGMSGLMGGANIWPYLRPGMRPMGGR